MNYGGRAIVSSQRYLPIVTFVIGIVLVALGLGSMFGYGVGYAIVSLSCTIGPFLAVNSAARYRHADQATAADGP